MVMAAAPRPVRASGIFCRFLEVFVEALGGFWKFLEAPGAPAGGSGGALVEALFLRVVRNLEPLTPLSSSQASWS